MLWYAALLEVCIGALMAISHELFDADVYQTINGRLDVVSDAFVVSGTIGLLAAGGLAPRRFIRLVMLAAAVPPALLALNFLLAGIASGVVTYTTLSGALVVCAIWEPRRAVRPFIHMAGATLALIGVTMVLAGDNYADQLTYSDLGRYLWIVAPLFLIGGLGLIATEIRATQRGEASRLLLAFACIAAIDCGILVTTFASTHVWTGVIAYGLMAIMLLIAAPRLSVWLQTPVLFASMAAVAATGDLVLGILSRFSGARLFPPAALMEPVAALGIAYVSIGLALSLYPHRPIARRLIAALALCAAGLAVAGFTARLGGPAPSGQELLGHGAAAAIEPRASAMFVVLAGSALVLTHLRWPRARAIPHLYVSASTALIGTVALNVIAYMESSSEVLDMLGATAMREHATIVVGTLALAFAAAGTGRLFNASIGDRLFGAAVAIGILIWTRSAFLEHAFDYMLQNAFGPAWLSTHDTFDDAAKAMALLAGAVAVGVAMLFLRTVTLPLNEVTHAIARARAGERRAQALVEGEDEIALVARSFNQLTRELADQSEMNEAVRAAQSDLGEATVVTESGAAIEWNDALTRITGYNDTDLRGMRLVELVPSDLRTEVAAFIYAHRREAFRFETAILRRNGERADIECAVSPLAALGRKAQLVLIRDISERKSAERALERVALQDALTGLPNRAAFSERVTREAKRAAAASDSFAIVYFDVDRFKEVNDAFGHDAGDALLRELAARLGRALPWADAIARFGGDEFAVLLSGSRDMATATAAAEIVRDALRRPFELCGHQVFVEASIGIVRFPTDGGDAEALLRHADVAMYDAKHTGKMLAVYAPETDPQNERRLGLMSDLRHAIERDELLLHFQPQVRLASGGTCASVEALVRWKHPVRGMVSPGEFIPIAEDSGFINELTRWVINEATASIASLTATGFVPKLALNISARDLYDPGLADAVELALRASRLDASRLTIEITETAVMSDARRSLETLARLAALGVRLSIDDFGAGYSSLAYLRRLPVNELKIDRMFVADMLATPSSDAIVSSVIQLGHSLGLSLVAEGVEDADTQAALRARRCDIAQGFHIARPMPLDALRAWLATREDRIEILSAAD